MADTAKMKRPRFPRTNKDASGRVEHDSRGNAVFKRTRATDAADVQISASLEILDDSPPGRGVIGAGAVQRSRIPAVKPKKG